MNIFEWSLDWITELLFQWGLSMMCSCGRPRMYDAECRDCYEARILRETRHQYGLAQWDETPSTATYLDRREDSKYKGPKQ